MRALRRRGYGTCSCRNTRGGVAHSSMPATQDEVYCSTSGFRQEIRCSIIAAPLLNGSSHESYLTYQSCAEPPSEFVALARFEVRSAEPANARILRGRSRSHRSHDGCDRAVDHAHALCRLVRVCDSSQTSIACHPAPAHTTIPGMRASAFIRLPRIVALMGRMHDITRRKVGGRWWHGWWSV